MTAQDSRRRRRAAAIACALALTLTGCGGTAAVDESADRQPSASTTTTSSSTPAPTTSSSAPPAATGTTVTTGASEYGVMLFDDRNQAIYLFDAESSGGAPACYDDCAADWPPVLTDGAPQASGEVQGGLLGTVARSDGSMQVTYGGHPLYFYAHEGPGEVLCHDVDDYGGTWLVVTPAGEAAPA